MFPGLGSLVERLPCGASVVPFHAVGVVGLAQITFRGAGEHLQLVVALGGDAVQDVGAASPVSPAVRVVRSLRFSFTRQIQQWQNSGSAWSAQASWFLL